MNDPGVFGRRCYFEEGDVVFEEGDPGCFEEEGDFVFEESDPGVFGRR